MQGVIYLKFFQKIIHVYLFHPQDLKKIYLIGDTNNIDKETCFNLIPDELSIKTK